MKSREKRRNHLYSIDTELISSRSKSKCSNCYIPKQQPKKHTYHQARKDRFTICHDNKPLPPKYHKQRTRTLTHHEDIQADQKYYLRSSTRKPTNREHLLTERKGNESSRKVTKLLTRDRMHTVTHGQDEKYQNKRQNHQEEVIKGCIAQLQNILVDISNNKNTHRRLLSQRSYKEVNGNECEKKQTIKKKHIQQTIQPNKNKQKSFKSYLQFIKNRKREGKVNLMKKMRKGQEIGTKNIKKTIQLISETKQNMNESHLRQKTQFQFGQCQTIEEKNSVECSSIQKINQSSFLSDFGKKILKQVRQNEDTGRQKKQSLINNFMRKPSNRKKQKNGLKNRSSIKNNFPQGFFI